MPVKFTVTFDAADHATLAQWWAVLADPEGNEFCVLLGRVDSATATA